jgi:tRNA U34 5-methylaminomethyl-2-thiouridine-forming methyltransferase MnmC
VQLASGVHSVHSLAHGETFHPVVGPVAEAEALYVKQLRLRERLQAHAGEFVVWDVGLGAAANVLTVLRATAEIPAALRVVSFDCTPEPLEFALQHASELGYFGGYEAPLQELLQAGRVRFQNGRQAVDWDLHLADFPTLLAQPTAHQLPKPHAILFDAFSPAKNPHMWTPGLFRNLFQLLDPARPCALPTYSRSTMLRVTLLLAGFYVGVGHSTGEKEETTLAANTLSLLADPLPPKWLERARVSYSAEPMWDAVYRQAPLSPESWAKLQAHPQFAGR